MEMFIDTFLIAVTGIHSLALYFDHIDKTYEMPKTAVSYRKPRMLSEEQREAKKKYDEDKQLEQYM